MGAAHERLMAACISNTPAGPRIIELMSRWAFVGHGLRSLAKGFLSHFLPGRTLNERDWPGRVIAGKPGMASNHGPVCWYTQQKRETAAWRWRRADWRRDALKHTGLYTTYCTPEGPSRRQLGRSLLALGSPAPCQRRLPLSPTGQQPTASQSRLVQRAVRRSCSSHSPLVGAPSPSTEGSDPMKGWQGPRGIPD